MKKLKKRENSNIVLVLIVVILMATAIASASISYISIRDESINTFTQRNQGIANQIDGWIDLKKSIVEQAAIMLHVTNVDHAYAISHFYEIIRRNPDISDLYIGFPDGFGISGYGHPLLPDWRAYERPWYIAAANNPGAVVYTQPYICSSTGQLIFTATRTVCDYDDSLGVIGIDVFFTTKQRFIEEVNAEVQDSTIILDGAGYILMHGNPDYAPLNGVTFQNKAIVADGRYAPMVDAIFNSGIFIDDDYVYVGASLATTGWMVVTRTPFTYLTSNFAATFTGIAATVSLALVGILWALLMLRRVRQTLRKEHEAHEMTEIFFNNSPFVMSLWDSEMKLVRVGPQVVQMFDLDNERQYFDEYEKLSPEFQPCGKPSRELMSEYLKEAYEKGSSEFEWMRQTLKGEPLPTKVTITRFRSAEGYMLAAFTVDLRPIMHAMETARVAQEESLAKTRFLARMSHELRTPMNAVIGITEIELRKGGHPPETDEALLRIHNSSHLLRTIINDILDLSQVESGKLEINPDEYEIASLISDTVTLNRMHISEKDIDFHLRADENLPSRLIGDELRIKQILNNLLTNAFKYTRAGRVIFSFESERAPGQGPDDTVLCIRIQDTGQGMSKEQVDKLFNTEFTRYNLESNQLIEGSGLGLAITYSLVKLMQGDIEVESELGKGSIFTVHLPQKTVNGQILGKEAAANLQKFNFSRSMSRITRTVDFQPMPYGRVLIVDDTESNLYVAKGLLKQYQLNIDTADSGFDAIAKIESGEEYDIIFMDHMMPGMDGIQTTKIIRETGYKRPIVALTANALVDSVDLFLSNGFTGFISKPIDIERLNDYLVRYIYDRHRSAASASLPGASVTDEPKDISNDELVKFAVSDAKKILSVLEYVAVLRKLDDSTFRSCTIQFHSAKSVLNNLGEAELAGIASALEDAARGKDSDVIFTKLPGFLAEFKKTVAELSPKAEANTDSAVNENTSLLREQLEIIENACQTYDGETAKNAINLLRQNPCAERTLALLDQMAECLLLSEFEECAILAKEAAATTNA